MSEGPGWSLHLGDCIEFMRTLPDKSVDHVICDPPYSDHVHENVLAGNDSAGGIWFEARPVEFEAFDSQHILKYGAELGRVAARWVVTFCAIESAGDWRTGLTLGGLEYVRTGAWVKPGAPPQFTGDRPGTGFEALVIAHQSRAGKPIRKRWNGGGRPGLWTNDIARGKRHHETEKPLALMSALVRDFTDPGDTIFDPFAGSGTTGVAAIRLGRKFIGCELDPKYHAIATKRLTNAREQLGLWTGSA